MFAKLATSRWATGKATAPKGALEYDGRVKDDKSWIARTLWRTSGFVYIHPKGSVDDGKAKHRRVVFPPLIGGPKYRYRKIKKPATARPLRRDRN